MRFGLMCSICGRQLPFTLQGEGCDCGGTMLAVYDIEWVKNTMTKESLSRRAASMWRYAELLPVEKVDNIVSLGEGWTPLIRLYEAEKLLPLRNLWVKREEQNPTGSFKSRGFSAALSIAKEHRIRKVAVNSNGNAASALAAYAAYAGMEAYVFVPKDCPGLIVEECVDYGAKTYLVDGFIHDAGLIIKQGEADQGWYNVGTLKEPGRSEGKKTMGLELAEQLGWRMPDVIIYPTGGGSGVIGMWNAFRQLKQLGFVHGELPRIICVQEEGCQPLADAVQAKGRFVPQHDRVVSNPTGMRVPNPPDGELLVSILRSCGGTSIAVSAQEIKDAQRSMGKQGISASPEGAATWAALIRLLDQGYIRREDEVVLFNTSHSMKYKPWSAGHVPVVKTYEDWQKLQESSV